MKTQTEKRFKILVADDNIDNIQVIGNILRENGYDVGYAINGQQAIVLLKNTIDYDLVLLDVDMPLMDGFETCRLIRKDKMLKDIPVIFLTAFTEVDKIIAGFDAGAHDYITKPFNSKELLARVNTHLLLKYRTDQLSQINGLLEQNNKDITDSIIYARRIQSALLPSKRKLEEKIPDCFILNKPKNIVSGDFYWFRQAGNFMYLVAADCTGHGVPGAFMSILAISIFNDIVKEDTLLTPGEILEKLKRKIIEMLCGRNPESETNDGIDLAICRIDLSNHIIQYAGASRPLIIVRENTPDHSFGIMQIRADQMPIGTYRKDDKNFTNHTLQLQLNDAIYLFSDGFASQFGGENNRTFRQNRLKELLLQIHDKPMELQVKLLENALNDWKRDLMQTDDILVIGLKVN